MNQLLVGNGSTESLWLIAFSSIKPDDTVLVIEPAFGEYRRNALLMGTQVSSYHASKEDNFELNIEAIQQQIETLEPQVVFCCNPNNPTGSIINLATIDTWCKHYPNTLFVIDEAYAQFIDVERFTIKKLNGSRKS